MSGTFSKVYDGYTYQILWSASQNVSSNSSTITCVHKLVCAAYWALYIGSRSNTCVVNGVSKSFTSNSINTDGGTTITLGTTTHIVNHDSDGNGKFSLTGTFNMQATISGAYVKNIVVTGNATLDTIPRKSSISFDDFTMGSAGTITINRASSDFTHTITYSFGSKTGTITTKTTSTSVSWTPAISELAGQIPNDVRGHGSFTVTTYSGSTSLGSNSYTFYCDLPSSVVPTVGDISITPQTYTYLLQNMNTVKVGVTGCSAGAGSNIKSYTFSGPGLSTTTTNTSAISSTMSTSGAKTYTVTVTDNRGRTASKTASITCYAYSTPYFSSLNAYRVASSSSMTADDSGTYIRYTYNVKYSSVNNANKITVRLKYKTKAGSWTYAESDIINGTATSGSKIIGTFDTSTTYIVCAEIIDNYTSSSATEITIFSAERIMNVRSNGKGIAFGKMAEEDNLLDCKWPIKSSGHLVATKPVTLFNSGDGGEGGDVALSESVVGYEYLEIFYADESGHVDAQSIRLCSPNNKTIDLTCIGAQEDSDKLYIKTSRYTIINNTVTFVRSKWVTLTNALTPKIVDSESTNYLRILRVVGFN